MSKRLLFKNVNLNLDEVISSEDLKQQTVKSSSQSCRPSLKHKNSVKTSQKSSKKAKIRYGFFEFFFECRHEGEPQTSNKLCGGKCRRINNLVGYDCTHVSFTPG